MASTVVLGGARTPFGKFGGALKDIKAVELGGLAIKEALKKANIDAGSVEEVIMGMVLQSGAGQIPSRQAAINAGLPWEVLTETINKVCASGLRSATLADQVIRSGDSDVIVAGGMENMSLAPYLSKSLRFGAKMGNSSLIDSLLCDGLWCSFHDVHMIEHGSNIAEKYNVSREAQDEWALRSHERANEAFESGRFDDEVVGIKVKIKREEVVVNKDESIRADTSLEKLSKLKPAYVSDGTVTPGNAPGINDGACAIVLASERFSKDRGTEPLATIVDHTSIGLKAEDFPITPAYAIEKLLKRNNLDKKDISLYEINEAFSVVALVNSQILGLDLDKVNVNGGAVAMGHPIGASGSRIILTLINELRLRGGGFGVAAICSGAAQGDAVLVKV